MENIKHHGAIIQTMATSRDIPAGRQERVNVSFLSQMGKEEAGAGFLPSPIERKEPIIFGQRIRVLIFSLAEGGLEEKSEGVLRKKFCRRGFCRRTQIEEAGKRKRQIIVIQPAVLALLDFSHHWQQESINTLGSLHGGEYDFIGPKYGLLCGQVITIILFWLIS